MEGLERSDKKVLVALADISGHLNNRQLAKKTSLNENTVHYSVSRLEHLGLVICLRTNKRSPNRVKITSQGKTLVGTLKIILDEEIKLNEFLHENEISPLLEKYR